MKSIQTSPKESNGKKEMEKNENTTSALHQQITLSSYKYMFYASYFPCSGDGAHTLTHPCRHQFHHAPRILCLEAKNASLSHVKSACFSRLPF